MVQISRPRNPSSSKRISSLLVQIFLTVFLSIISFYVGTLSSNSNHPDVQCPSNHEISNEQKLENEQRINQMVQQRLEQIELERTQSKNDEQESAKTISTPYFPKSTSSFLNGIVRVEKDKFMKKFDYGLPVEEPSPNNGEILLLYNSANALPTESESQRQVVQNDVGSSFVILDVDTATENCDTMNIIHTNNPGHTRQCLAIVGNYESYHIQRWMRVPETGGKLDKDEPLRAVSRGYDSNGAQQFIPPDEKTITKHWEMLKTYFDGFDDTLAKLKSIADKVAIKNTIIVMTCNMGQSELLMNFVCNAKAKGLDVSNVLVFPTDQETKDLAEGMGLATFYDEKNFGDMPAGEAKHYGDKAFVAMMFAKVVCVQMINFLGYDLLFQDVDLVWYQNPLEYFHDPQNEFHGFDMYFQDDGARTTRYAPLSANSGFYYVRHNQRTRYLFTSLLYYGDQIMQSHSHQEALVQLINEHSSLFGLKVKVLSRDMDEFPGGWHYHRHNKTFMMKVVKEEITPIIFHMSWTKNKDNKIKFYQQMGQWYVNEMCIAHTKSDIMGNFNLEEGDSLLETCCLAEPNIICHYRDKPSKIPCKDVDPIDAGRPSFW